MATRFARAVWGCPLVLVTAILVSTGCAQRASNCVTRVAADVPRELMKTTHPAYVIEPPDILQIDLISAVPKAPYRVRALDALSFNVANTLPDAPISGPYNVEPNGTVFLGLSYGSVSVAGLTLDEVRVATEKLLAGSLKNPVVNVSLYQARATQQVRGPHLVRPDGTIGLGSYGQVPVVGLTLPLAKLAIESHLKEYFQDPEVSIDVVGFNSKVYYVVLDYGGAGQQIVTQPATGNETVLDAIGRTGGLPTVADARGIWVARPGAEDQAVQVLPVDWKAVVEGADTRTNYQVLPGDRVFVKAYDIVAVDNKLARIIAPVERLLGVTLLGSSTVNTIRTDPNQFNSGFQR